MGSEKCLAVLSKYFGSNPFFIGNSQSPSKVMSSPSTFGENTDATVPNARVQVCYDYTVQPTSVPESPTSTGTFRFRGNAYCKDADGKLYESINTAGPHVDTSEKCLAVLSKYFGSNPFFIGMSQYSKYCSAHFVGGKVGQTEDLTIPNLPLLVDNLNKRTAWGGYQWYYHIRNGDSQSPSKV